MEINFLRDESKDRLINYLSKKNIQFEIFKYEFKVYYLFDEGFKVWLLNNVGNYQAYEVGQYTIIHIH